MSKEDALKQILVVEDEKPMARALELKLAGAGFSPSVTHNGVEAMAALKKNKYALVLLDLMMPVMDGFSVLEAMHKAKMKIPVVVLTNLSQEDDRARVMALGVKDFFVKSDTSIATVVNRVGGVVG